FRRRAAVCHCRFALLIRRWDCQDEMSGGIAGTVRDAAQLRKMHEFCLKPAQTARLEIVALGQDWLKASQPCEAIEVESRGLGGGGGDCSIDIEIAPGVDRPSIQVFPKDGDGPTL